MNNASRRLTALAFAFLFFTVSFAQSDSTVASDTALTAKPNNFDRFNDFYLHPMISHYEGSMLIGDYDLQYSSNMGVNKMAYNIYLQKPVPADAIQASVDKISAVNIGGRENNLGFKYIIPLKKYNNFLFVKYRFTRHQSTKFTDDFGKFFFQGNKQFAGDTIIADDLRYLTTKYDGLQVGWTGYFNINHRPANLSVSAGVTRGFEYRRIKIHRGRIFTEQNGDYVDVSLDMEAQQSYFSPLQLAAHSGFGALADINFNMMLGQKSSIGIDITDLGFISWDDNSAVYERHDTTVRFDGVFIPSIDSLNSPEYTEKIGDSIVTTFNIPYEVGTFKSALPTKIRITYTMGFTQKNYLNVKLNMMAFTTFRPQLAFESLNFIGTKLYSTTGVAFGGFGPFNLYQRVGWQIDKRFFVGAGLFGIESMLLPTKLAGFGGNVTLSARL